jgi:hypothetical protein
MGVVHFAQYVLGGGLAMAVAAFFIGAAIMAGIRFGEHISDQVSDWYCVRQAGRHLDHDYAHLCGEEESA